MITLEKGIPFPEEKKYGKKGYAQAMRNMEVGDSFRANLFDRGQLYTNARNIGIKVSTHKEGDLLRVWRIA